jgi:DNA polymerase III alpha subunit (gram-positive type)
MSNLLFIDVETGGLQPREHALLSVACLAVIDDRLVDMLYLQLQPVKTVTVDALRVNRINLDEHRAYGMHPRDAYHHFQSWMQRVFQDKPYLVGWNVRFDAAFLDEWITESSEGTASLGTFASYRTIDMQSVVSYCIEIGLLPATVRGGLKGAVSYLLPTVQAEYLHHALYDATAVLGIYRALATILKGGTEHAHLE